MDKFFGWFDILDYGLYVRGIIITVYAIFLFRTSPTRLLGNHSTLDLVIFIILGAILGEAIVSNIPLLPSMITCLFIVIIHRFLAYITYKSQTIGKYIKGEKICIVKQGTFIEKNLKCCRITHHDILQALRIQHSKNDIQIVEEAILERGGQISFLFFDKNS